MPSHSCKSHFALANMLSCQLHFVQPVFKAVFLSPVFETNTLLYTALHRWITLGQYLPQVWFQQGDGNHLPHPLALEQSLQKLVQPGVMLEYNDCRCRVASVEAIFRKLVDLTDSGNSFCSCCAEQGLGPPKIAESVFFVFLCFFAATQPLRASFGRAHQLSCKSGAPHPN